MFFAIVLNGLPICLTYVLVRAIRRGRLNRLIADPFVEIERSSAPIIYWLYIALNAVAVVVTASFAIYVDVLTLAGRP